MWLNSNDLGIFSQIGLRLIAYDWSSVLFVLKYWLYFLYVFIFTMFFIK